MRDFILQLLITMSCSKKYNLLLGNAILIGGDSDTLDCITEGIAEAFYGELPKDISETAMNILDENLRETVIRLIEFTSRYSQNILMLEA